MDDKDHKRGFSGLSGLVSDIETISQAPPTQTDPPISSTQQPVFALLELTNWPTLPAPWSSVDAGETWVWGDFFLTFQKKPKTILDLALESEGKKAENQGIIYHYAISVFYRIDRNPHGPSHRPIMTIALEQADTGMLAKMLGDKAGGLVQAEVGNKMGPLMIGLVTGKARLNFGKYEGNTSPQAIKRRFFEILRQQLGVDGQPKLLGDMAQAHGHPETGLAAKKARLGRATGSGSRGKWILGIIAVVFLIWLINIENKTNKKSSTNSAPPPQSYNYPQNNTAQDKPLRDSAQTAELQYLEPSAGVKKSLSIAEIRWCVRESIRLESMRGNIRTNTGITTFNRMIDIYNNKCGNYTYYNNDQQKATAEVENFRTKIINEAIQDAKQLDSQPTQTNSAQFSPGNTYTTPEIANAQQIRDVQQRLSDLGFNPGTIDGKYGNQTKRSILEFQKANGLQMDGKVTQHLIDALAKAKNNKFDFDKWDDELKQTQTNDKKLTLIDDVGILSEGNNAGHMANDTKNGNNINIPSYAPTPKPLPKTGIINKRYIIGQAPFDIKTQRGANYFIKIENSLTGQEVLTAFIRGGEKFDISIPTGKYIVKYASGNKWFGPPYYFGDETIYSKADKIFEFEMTAAGYSGYTIELIQQINGNLQTQMINKNEF